MVREYNNDNFKDIKDLTIVDFYADWCGPCKMLGKVLEELDIDVIKVNVDKEEELAKEYKVMSIPNIYFFKNGEIEEHLMGFHSKEELEDIIKSLK